MQATAVQKKEEAAKEIVGSRRGCYRTPRTDWFLSDQAAY